MVEPRFTFRQSGSIPHCILPVVAIDKNRGEFKGLEEKMTGY